MKTTAINLLFILILVLSGCGQKAHDHQDQDASEALEDGGNEALYNEVMKIHDEVMPKMNDIYTLKQSLNEKLADSAVLSDSIKRSLTTSVSKLDSASESMMVWMRQFNPIPDSLGKERAREYLETEMEKVKKVRENITEALEEGKSLNK